MISHIFHQCEAIRQTIRHAGWLPDEFDFIFCQVQLQVGRKNSDDCNYYNLLSTIHVLQTIHVGEETEFIINDS